MFILVPYLHYIAIMSLMGALISEHLLLKPGITKQQIKSLAAIDLVYGIAAIVVLATGLLRWFVYGKGTDYYLSNPLFHIKLTLFIIVGILSIFPTIKFLKWRKEALKNETFSVSEKEARRQLIFIRAELLLIAIIPLLAVFIARGISM